MVTSLIALAFAAIVGIVDTGVAYTHTHFADTVVMGDTVDTCGHGTAMAGIVVDTAPHAELLSVNVEENCLSNYVRIAEGIRKAVDGGADVIVVAWRVTPTSPIMLLATGYAATHGATVVFSDGLVPVMRRVPRPDGSYGYVGGTSPAAAAMAGQLAWQMDSMALHLPQLEVH